MPAREWAPPSPGKAKLHLHSPLGSTQAGAPGGAQEGIWVPVPALRLDAGHPRLSLAVSQPQFSHL